MSHETQALGVDVGDLRMPIRDAIRTAAQLDFRAIELPAASGETTPQQLDQSARRHLARFVANHGLTLASLTADVPDTQFTDPASVERRLDHTRRIMELAAALHVPIVSASAGALIDPASGEPKPLVVEALTRVAEHADATGAIYALRPLPRRSGLHCAP